LPLVPVQGNASQYHYDTAWRYAKGWFTVVGANHNTADQAGLGAVVDNG
jgi:hypothetical protein